MKPTLFILSLILLGTANQYAQDKPAKGTVTAEEKAKLKEMRKDLNLTEEQKAKLKEIHKEHKATKEARKAKVDTILNNEQDAKMSEIRKKRREYRKD